VVTAGRIIGKISATHRHHDQKNTAPLSAACETADGRSGLPYEVELELKKNGEILTFELSARPLKKAGVVIGDLHFT